MAVSVGEFVLIFLQSMMDQKTGPFFSPTGDHFNMNGYQLNRANGTSISQLVHYEPGHVVIGALFPIHRNDENNCQTIWPEYGIQRTQIALETLDEINDNDDILKGIKLGIEIRDTCWRERVAVEQTIQLLRGTIDSSISTAGNIPEESKCTAAPKSKSNKLVAVIGPGSSDNSKAVHNLLQIFSIPQVGYSATSTELSNTNDYRYFMRLVPSDAWQAQAFVDIVKHFNWTYVSVLYSEGSYGQKGYEELAARITEDDAVCSGSTEVIGKDFTRRDFDHLIEILSKESKELKPKVVVCFCLGDDVREIFQAIKRYRNRHPGSNLTEAQFQWIGSESWADREDVVRGASDVAIGSMSLRIHSPSVPEFKKTFLALTPETNKRNPWFVEYWEQMLNCSLRNETLRKYPRVCSKDYKFKSGSYKEDTKLTQVKNSMYTVALALDRMFKKLCPNYINTGLCPAMNPVNGSELFHKYMLDVQFGEDDENEMYFDKRGDPPARYDILNYQMLPDGTYKYVEVGVWSSKTIDNRTFGIKFSEPVQYYTGALSNNSSPPVSICSTPCGFSERKKLHAEKCCWTCIRCNETEYLADEFTCIACKPGQWSNDWKTGCIDLEVEYLRVNSWSAIVAIIFACIGMTCSILITIIFTRFNSTPVVKSTTRELSYMILAGTFLCYGTTFIIVQEPSQATCYLIRIIPGIAFALMYASLLTKTNRIARILAGSKKRIITKKPKFLSTFSQVVISLILIGIETVIIIAMLIYQPAHVKKDYSRHRRVFLICNTTTLGFLAPFGFDFCLICFCTLYAVKTRNLPENFNEAKFIGFTMYTTCIIWLAFVTIYFGSDSKSITMCFSFSLSATVALVLLFFPKIYIILFKPDKNVRSSYATSKVIRCHFGASQSQASSVGISSSIVGHDRAKGRMQVDTNNSHKSPLSRQSTTTCSTGISSISVRGKGRLSRSSFFISRSQTLSPILNRKWRGSRDSRNTPTPIPIPDNLEEEDSNTVSSETKSQLLTSKSQDDGKASKERDEGKIIPHAVILGHSKLSTVGEEDSASRKSSYQMHQPISASISNTDGRATSPTSIDGSQVLICRAQTITGAHPRKIALQTTEAKSINGADLVTHTASIHASNNSNKPSLADQEQKSPIKPEYFERASSPIQLIKVLEKCCQTDGQLLEELARSRWLNDVSSVDEDYYSADRTSRGSIFHGSSPSVEGLSRLFHPTTVIRAKNKIFSHTEDAEVTFVPEHVVEALISAAHDIQVPNITQTSAGSNSSRSSSVEQDVLLESTLRRHSSFKISEPARLSPIVRTGSDKSGGSRRGKSRPTVPLPRTNSAVCPSETSPKPKQGDVRELEKQASDKDLIGHTLKASYSAVLSAPAPGVVEQTQVVSRRELCRNQSTPVELDKMLEVTPITKDTSIPHRPPMVPQKRGTGRRLHGSQRHSRIRQPEPIGNQPTFMGRLNYSIRRKIMRRPAIMTEPITEESSNEHDNESFLAGDSKTPSPGTKREHNTQLENTAEVGSLLNIQEGCPVESFAASVEIPKFVDKQNFLDEVLKQIIPDAEPIDDLPHLHSTTSPLLKKKFTDTGVMNISSDIGLQGRGRVESLPNKNQTKKTPGSEPQTATGFESLQRFMSSSRSQGPLENKGMASLSEPLAIRHSRSDNMTSPNMHSPRSDASPSTPQMPKFFVGNETDQSDECMSLLSGEHFEDTRMGEEPMQIEDPSKPNDVDRELCERILFQAAEASDSTVV